MTVNLMGPETISTDANVTTDQAAAPAANPEENTRTNGEVTAPTIEEAKALLDAKAAEEVTTLLRQVGLGKVPTIEEAKALLDARREEIRAAVLQQADERDWCYDGTRKVCANLRLRKPDDRSYFTVKVRMVVEMTARVRGFTLDSAMQRHVRGYSSQGISWLSARWLSRYLPDMNVSQVTVESLLGPDGNPIDYASLVKKGEVSG